jgi:hypothetical protein
MHRRRRALADWLAAGVIGALVFAWFGHAFLNYDTFYALVWGSDLAHGRTPQYSVPVAPTPHPLAELIGFVLTPFGAAAEDLMLALGLLGLGMLAVGLFRLGGELFGVWVGIAAAAILMTRVPILNFGVRGYVDLPTCAFVVWAAVLEARQPRRGAPVLILLALAGLLRPEAWLYAAAYCVWLLADPARRDRGSDPVSLHPARIAGDRGSDHLSPPAGRRRAIRLIALGAAAPLIWMGSDLLITGNPLHSLIGTHDLAAALGRKTGIGALPEVAPRRLGEILRLPELLAAVAGLAFGLAWMRDRVRLPLAIAVLNGLAFTAFAIAGLPLLGRYLFVAASMLALLAGLGALGWTALARDHPGRRAWTAVGAAALLAIVAFFPLQQVDRLDALKADIAARDRIQADLRELVQRPEVKTALRGCRSVLVPSHRLVPLIALWADVRPQRIITPRAHVVGGSCVVFPATEQVAKLAVLDPNEPGASLGSYHGRVDVRNRSWLFAG